jgi:hyaluronoglucosaminidase
MVAETRAVTPPSGIPELGIVEGFYGPAWSWAERRAVVETLAPAGYGFYLYAPKGDAFLRRRWTEPWADAEAAEIAAFSAFCRARGVRFGVGLSPFEIYRDFSDAARAALAAKLVALDALGIDDLAILFDDMAGDALRLAETQAQVAHFAAERTGASRVIVCPSYYSDDPVLDRVFGARPPGYLDDLGRMLDPALDIFWTGEEVCSRELSPAHLGRVADMLRRKPFLWDNYPVNDGPRMSQHLHLRAFTGRPAANADLIAAHGVNPALQPVLSCIPMLTLRDCYKPGYAYGAAFADAARAVAGDALAAMLTADMLTFDDGGLGRMTDDRRQKLRARYVAVDHPAAREVVRWLDGGYAVSAEDVATQ